MVTEDKVRKKLEPNTKLHVIKIFAECLRQHFRLWQLSDRIIDKANHYDTRVTLVPLGKMCSQLPILQIRTCSSCNNKSLLRLNTRW